MREDLQCSHATVARYVRSLNQLFFTFEVPPYFKKFHRPVKKEKKLYFFNPAAVQESGDAGVRFENMIALLLSKWCSSARERAAVVTELRGSASWGPLAEASDVGHHPIAQE